MQAATGGRWVNCQVTNNASLSSLGGGGDLLNCSNYQFRNCQFTANRAPTNYGGGLHLANVTQSQLVDCVFEQNAAQAGGGIFTSGSSLTAINSFFTRNSNTVLGGAVASISSSTATFTNTTFRANTGPAGAIYTQSSTTNLINSVLWDNNGSDALRGSVNNISYSLLQSGVSSYVDGGANQIVTFDPFENASGPQLTQCTPAVDAGNDAANATAIDLLGNARKVRQIDMGAAEYQGAAYDPPMLTTLSQTATTVCQGTEVGFTFSGRFGSEGGSVGLYRGNTLVANAIVGGPYGNFSSYTFRRAIVESGPYQLVLTTTSGCRSLTATFAPITVNPLPVVAITGLALAYCQNAPAVTLTGAPSGGRFSVDGNTATAFTPTSLSVGTHTVVYSYTNSSGCSNSVSQTIQVNPTPVFSVTPPPAVCA
ncbi:MAG: right-handed parallel beta-helix repeat-containing protein, partial [Cytophagaceae bacterium]